MRLLDSGRAKLAALLFAALQFVIDGLADELGASLTWSPQVVHPGEGSFAESSRHVLLLLAWPPSPFPFSHVT
jgi:hypothetical protein